MNSKQALIKQLESLGQFDLVDNLQLDDIIVDFSDMSDEELEHEMLRSYLSSSSK